MPARLDGLRVISFESRRAPEMAELIRNFGGEPIQAPSMREVPLADQHAALVFGESLIAGEVDVLVLLTGVGTRMLLDALSTRWPRDQVIAALGRATLVCRGPKPVGVLKEIGLSPALTVPEPNTWRDLLSALDRQLPVRDKRVAVQEYGARNEELLAELGRRGVRATPVPIYAWALPEDIGPLRAGIERVVAGEVDVALFTSATQIEHLFRVATEMRRAAALRDALARSTVVASIGPVTTEALRERGVAPDVEPEHPKMGQLVLAVSQHAPRVLAEKRRT
jgi:uroporphyrinogen-III synthase